MKLSEQHLWVDKTIQQKQRALTEHEHTPEKRRLIEGDIVALQAISLTIRLHRAMRDAVKTVNAMPQSAQFLRDSV